MAGSVVVALPRGLEPHLEPRYRRGLRAIGCWRFLEPGELAGPGAPPDLESARGLVLPWDERVPTSVLMMLPSLEIVSVLGTGVWDDVDVPELSRRGIAVANTPGYAANAVAEHTLALLLAVLRDIPATDRAVRSGAWQATRTVARELMGLTLGVVGLGSIGSRVAELGRCLGMRVLVHTRHPERHVMAGVMVVDLDTLLRKSDVVTLHTTWQGGPPLLGRAELGLMRPGALLINTARGQLVDEEALADALEAGHLGGAGLDVFSREPPSRESRLLRLRRVVLSPHCAAHVASALSRAASTAIENLLAFFSGRPQNVVNRDVLRRPLRASPQVRGLPEA